MRVGIIGTGTVGRTLAAKLVSLGHEVTLGSRTKENAAALAWAEQAGPYGHSGTFAEAAAFGELVINATSGVVAVQALRLAGAEPLAGKVLIDVSNPLVFSPLGEVSLEPVNSDSVGEQIQREFPAARVVKALNTVNSEVMVDPGRVPGEHNLFVAGNDPEAKAEVVALLTEFGWPQGSVLDLGDITAARALEMLMPFWLKLMGHYGHADFNYSIRRAG
ncbi:NAD(P)-binding domain-containing protein [Kitasatospora sp. NPDC002040]|uniref:NADPH-dependent F420 reductase n=1 Tax=Kitasatospora sp. NPDC002040 TaxID=3154661 RepID=UPI00332627CE